MPLNKITKRASPVAGLGDVDEEQAEMAAKSIQDAINVAMNSKRGTKIIFLCLLDGGRVRHADLHVIETVMGNITTEKNGEKGANKNNYAVAINKVTKKFMNMPAFQEKGKQEIANFFNLPDLPFGTTNVQFIEEQLNLKDIDNA